MFSFGNGTAFARQKSVARTANVSFMVDFLFVCWYPMEKSSLFVILSLTNSLLCIHFSIILQNIFEMLLIIFISAGDTIEIEKNVDLQGQ